MGNVLPIVSRHRDFQSVFPHSHTGEPISKIIPQGPQSISSKSAVSSAKSVAMSETFEESDLSVTYNSCIGDTVDFDLTEGQMRRDSMLSCENQCSQITRFVYVGGLKVASNLQLLKEKKITRIVNCCLAVTKNHFEHLPEFKYLSLNMVDGKSEDIGWFACQVIQFIVEGCNHNEHTLVHCEKGISRSCSLVIAYKMWASGIYNEIDLPIHCNDPFDVVCFALFADFFILQANDGTRHSIMSSDAASFVRQTLRSPAI
jgi:protein-tyrosine phosphatase